MTEYCRVFDNVLYKAHFEELLEMELPSANSVTSSVSTSNDLGFDAYLDRVPVGIRQLGWNMLTAAVGTQLQQHDDESDTTYNMRRSSGDLGLALTKAVLFDIDNSSGWMRFASPDDDSLRGELRIRARNNSELTKQLPVACQNRLDQNFRRSLLRWLADERKSQTAAQPASFHDAHRRCSAECR